MTTSPDPVRLRSRLGGTSALGRALQAAQADAPDDQQLEALERAVFACVGATAAVATAALVKAAPAAKVGIATWFGAGSAKLVLAALVTSAALGGGTLLVLQQTRAIAPKQNRSLPATSSQPIRPSIAPMATPVADPRATAMPVAAPLDQPAHAASADPNKTKAAAPSRNRRAGNASAAGDDEFPLLDRAHRALPRDPAGALALADEHRRRFPGSSLDQERELIAITALVDLGRMAEARRKADEFTRQYPASAYVGRIHTLVNAQAK
jgi:hypothetical protein